MQRWPNFLYIGTSKAGSTWLYNLLDNHPQIYMAPGKGTYFFDRHFDKGFDWYLDHFRMAGDQSVLGEVSHSYLFSHAACERIAAHCQDVRLMVCLREPTSRAFSAYLDAVKNGAFHGSFEDALKQMPSLRDRGRYATYLRPYIARFGIERIYVGDFAELAAEPTAFAHQLFRFLQVEETPLSPELLQKRMPAGTPRSRSLVWLAKRASRFSQRAGLKRLIGKVKTSVFIRNVLYRPFDLAERPQAAPETIQRLKDEFAGEIRQLDRMLGTDFEQRWGYARTVHDQTSPDQSTNRFSTLSKRESKLWVE